MQALLHNRQQIVHGHKFVFWQHSAGFNLRQVQQLARELAERLGFRDNFTEQAVLALAVQVGHVAHCVGDQADGSDGRAQLMRDVGDKITPRPAQALQLSKVVHQQHGAVFACSTGKRHIGVMRLPINLQLPVGRCASC